MASIIHFEGKEKLTILMYVRPLHLQGNIRDPKLTEKGRAQAANLRNDVILKIGA